MLYRCGSSRGCESELCAHRKNHKRTSFCKLDSCGLPCRPIKKVGKTIRAKRPAQQLQAAIAKFTFTIEHRGKVWVLQEKRGGCRPATMYEVVMWKFLQRAAV